MIFDSPDANPFPVISPRLIVRPYGPRDLPVIAARQMELEGEALRASDAEIRAEQVLAQYQSYNAREHVVVGVFALEDERRLAGHFNAHVTGNRPGEWEIGYHVPLAVRGAGVMGECVRAMVPVFRGRLGAKHLVANVRHENVKSQKILESAGFRQTRADSTRAWFALGL